MSPRQVSDRRNRRISTACEKCHASKVKCSGQQPCTKCQKDGNSETCRFKIRDRDERIRTSELLQLRADSRELRELKRCNTAVRRIDVQQAHDASTEQHDLNPDVESEDMVSLFENEHGLFSGQSSSEPVFVGEGACTAFGDRLLQCVSERIDSISSNTMPNHLRYPICNRLLNTKPQLPDRGQANLLINRALRFIGTDYHLLLRKSFFQKLDEAYAIGRPRNLQWACQLFALLAIGEMYSHTSENAGVPGSSFFLQAVSLMQDCYEEPSVEQVQSLLLLSFYANVLGRIKSAHVYAGIGIRLAIGLGLHRSQLGLSTMDPIQRENRRRVWWTLYLFDRLTASKLGYPLAIQDDDIDVEMPSMNGLSEQEKEEFAEPEHLCANVKLAKITGSILNEIYSLPRRHTRPFIQRVHKTLNDLRKWDAELPPHLHLVQPDSSTSPRRGVSSLHMLYDLCIIQTTRPILFHIFKTQIRGRGLLPNDFPSGSSSSVSPPPPSSSPQDAGAGAGVAPPRSSPLTTPTKFSPTALMLAESCIQAARNLNQILNNLFVGGELAVFGYFDTHYLFSSTLILIVSVALAEQQQQQQSATAADAAGHGMAGAAAAAATTATTAEEDGIRTAMYLLRKMAESGNVPAGDYLRRLEEVRESVGRRNAMSTTTTTTAMMAGGQQQQQVLGWRGREGLQGQGEGQGEGMLEGFNEQQQQQQQQQPLGFGPAAIAGFGGNILLDFATPWDVGGLGGEDALENIQEFLNSSIELPAMSLPDEGMQEAFHQYEWDEHTDMRLLGLDQG